MAATKLKAPDEMAGFSYKGVSIEIPEDGIVEVSNNDEMVQEMQTHGFTLVVAEAAQASPAAPARRPRVKVDE